MVRWTAHWIPGLLRSNFWTASALPSRTLASESSWAVIASQTLSPAWRGGGWYPRWGPSPFASCLGSNLQRSEAESLFPWVLHTTRISFKLSCVYSFSFLKVSSNWKSSCVWIPYRIMDVFTVQCFWVFLGFFSPSLVWGLELRAYTSSHSTTRFLWWVFSRSCLANSLPWSASNCDTPNFYLLSS
jgi:hypothetical protein